MTARAALDARLDAVEGMFCFQSVHIGSSICHLTELIRSEDKFVNLKNALASMKAVDLDHLIFVVRSPHIC